MTSPVLASAFLVDGGNCFRAIPSSPGRRVEFRANLATVRDERDLIACLRHPGVQVVVEPDYVDWIAARMNECGTVEPPKGELTLPPEYRVFGEPGQYTVLKFTPTNESGTEGTIEPALPPIELPDVDPDAAPLPKGVKAEAWHPAGGRKAK